MTRLSYRSRIGRDMHDRPPKPQVPPAEDLELVRSFVASRDDDAFAELVTRYGPMVLAACRRIVPDAHLADDAFQAVFLVLATKAHLLDARKPIGPWLYTVAFHVAVRARTMIGRRQKREILPAVMPEVPGIVAAPDDATVLLDQEIGKLPVAGREAVVLCELQGLSRKDAAARLGIKEGTLSSRLAAARKTLAARLRARGVTGPLVMAGVVVPLSLASAAAACADGTASQTGIELAKGAMRTMFLSKLRLASILLAVAAVLFGIACLGGSLALAAWTVPDPGLIWLHDQESGKLTAYSPDGKKKRELDFSDGRRFIGFTENGGRMLFAAQGKKAGATIGDRHTLHLRDTVATTEEVDTGFAYQSGDQYIFSPDGGKLVLQRRERAADHLGYPKYTHLLVDTASGKETKIPLAANWQVMQWTADGKAWRVFELDYSKDKSTPKCRWWSVPVDGGEPSPLCDTHSLNWLQPSPEGKGFLATGSVHPQTDAAGPGVFRFDAAMGEATRIKSFENAAYLVARGSPDGKRVVCMKYQLDASRKVVFGSQLVLFDADGKNETTLIDFPGNTEQTTLMGWFPTRPKTNRFDPSLLAVAHAEPAAQANQSPAGQNRPIQLHAPKGDSPAAKQLAEIFEAANDRLREAKQDEVSAILIDTVSKIVAHARNHPADETSLRGLINAIGVASSGPRTAKTDPEAAAKTQEELFEVLKAHFAKSPGIRPNLPYLANEFSDGARAFVREVIREHPDKAIRAYAAKEMIKALETQSAFLNGIANREETRALYEKQIGKVHLQKILDGAPQKITQFQKEIEAYRVLLRTDLKGQLPDLEIGAVAPETVSADPEGKPVRLSDLRGKVVVLDFWGVWCEPCRRLIPHSRELVKRFEGKPFVFVNICVRDEKETLAEFLRKEPMPWTHWWDPKAAVAEQWDIAAFPTLYVIDHKGVIRFMTRGYDPKTGTLEKKLEELIKVAEGEK